MQAINNTTKFVTVGILWSFSLIYVGGYKVIEMSDDSKFKAVVAPPEEEAQGGREPVAAKPTAGAKKKRGAAAGAASQKAGGGKKLITEAGTSF